MNEVQKKIREAVGALVTISVRGDDVERMAAAKMLLQAAFELAGKLSEKEGERDAG